MQRTTVPRQKSAPKRKKRAFCVSTIPTLPSSLISITMPCTPLAPISGNRIPRKGFYLSKKIVIYKAFCSRDKLIIII